MKKLLTIFLVLVLILAGVFFWKGGHHALFLAEIVGEWLDADDADQAMTLQLQRPGFTSDGGTITPEVEQLSLSADTFWTEYADRPLFGVTAQGVTAYTDGKNLYLDTGKAYALPELSGLRDTARRLALGLLLHGRVTKNEDTYRIDMDTQELELHIVLSVDRTIRAGTVTAVLPDDTAVSLSMKTKEPQPHAIPQPVLDAMVRCKMEPPMPLTEPLELLIPALQSLLPLEGDLTLGVECGILNLSETAVLRVAQDKAELERNGVSAELILPAELSQTDPAALALLLLRNGDFTREGDCAQLEVSLPADAANQLCTALVPQLADLGIVFSGSTITLTIEDNKFTAVSMTADGEVPFLIAAIPVSFRAELTIR